MTAVGVAALVASAAACEGFYADVPTPTSGPAATPTAEGAPAFTGTRAEIAEAAARAALAERLGIEPEAPSFAGLRGATWTRADPGCYPPPQGFEGDYLIPGLRLSLVHQGVRYEYHADVPATTGALCAGVPQTPQEVGVSLAGDAVRTLDASWLAGRVVTLTDADSAAAFVGAEPWVAEIALEDIDWAAETLVGTALPDAPAGLEVSAAAGIWDMDSNVVTIRLETEAPVAPAAGPGGESPAAVWVLVEYPPAGAGFEFRVMDSAPAAP